MLKFLSTSLQIIVHFALTIIKTQYVCSLEVKSLDLDTNITYLHNTSTYLENVHFCWVLVITLRILRHNENENVVVQLFWVFACKCCWLPYQLHWELFHRVLKQRSKAMSKFPEQGWHKGRLLKTQLIRKWTMKVEITNIQK